MTVPRPTDGEIDSAAQHFGLSLNRDDRDEFAALITRSLESYDSVDELYEAIAPQPPRRESRTPSATDNLLNGWYVESEISTGHAGPLSGRTVAVKDNIAVAGIPMMNGSRSLEGYVPSRDATVVTRVLEAGAVVAGKSVCEDLCFSGSSYLNANGPVLNPWDTTRETGGSSSGSAALVASGAVDLALGGDQGGSIRMPAAFCGIVGHKPTFGLVPYTGAFPIERTIDHLGPMTRTVADAARMLSVIAGGDGLDPRQRSEIAGVDYVAALTGDVRGMRVGIMKEGFGTAHSDPKVDELVRSTAVGLHDLGVTAEEVSVPWHTNAFDIWKVIYIDGSAYQMDGNGYGFNVEGYYDPELMEHFGRERIARADELAETIKLTALTGYHGVKTLGGANYAKAQNLVASARAAYDRALLDYDVLVMPTVPYTARTLPLERQTRQKIVSQALDMIGNTAPFDATGHPAVTVPAGLVDGLPVGMMIVANRFDDATALRLADAFERHVGGFPVPSGY